MLAILVSDWRNREKDSQGTIPLSEVVRLLGGEEWREINDNTATVEIVDVIHNFLADHGTLREAAKTAHQYETREELLRETTLMGVMQDWKAVTAAAGSGGAKAGP